MIGKLFTKSLPWVIILVFLFAPIGTAQPQTVPVTVLHVNDLHGHLLPGMDRAVSDTVPVGGAARLAKMIADERLKNPDGTLLLSAGDMFQGTPMSNIFRGQSVITVMNELKFDAMAIGNHEFDWGQAALLNLARSAVFPFLSANIEDSQGRIPPFAKPSVVLTRHNLKIAVIGTTIPETGFTTKPDHVSGLTFKDPADVLPGLVKEARSGGADLIVLLSHLGLDADLRIAEQVPGIDVIVGGHSHTAMTHSLRVNETVIVQAGSHGAYLGVLNLTVEPQSRKVVDYTRGNELKTVFAGPNDPVDEAITKTVARFNDQIKTEFARVVGETAVDLTRNSRAESNVGDLVSDAMRSVAGVQIAFHNSGGMRADIAKGNITLEQVYTLLPFDNSLVSMDLTGDQIRRVLEQSVSFEHGILQVSGLTVRYDLTRPFGSRALDVTVTDQPLEPSKTYRVVTNDFLAAGGDHFAVFREGTNITYGDSLRDAFTAYLERHSPVRPEPGGRIVFAGL